jgi:SHS2 domain-containing protein
VRLELPQSYEDLDHTADVGVAVEGNTPEEALARLVLAQSSLLAGGGSLVAERADRVTARGADRSSVAVECLRELLFRFATAREIAAWCEVESFAGAGPAAATLVVGLARWDPERHAEGIDLKAVTLHASRFEERGGRWRAQVVFDI